MKRDSLVRYECGGQSIGKRTRKDKIVRQGDTIQKWTKRMSKNGEVAIDVGTTWERVYRGIPGLSEKEGSVRLKTEVYT